ncbi:MAG TPA: PD-(D/E)XK nuclease family protein, partial [Acidimicrobiales bacterium]
MTVELVQAAYGPPALDALARVVAQAKADEPLTPVTVVVPSNHVGVTARRALASARRRVSRRGSGIIGVTFLTPYRLAELLGAPALAAAGRRPVSHPVIAAALRRALRDEPGVFGPVAEHAATEEALVASARELADLSSAALDRLAATSPRAADVVRLFRQARSLLASGWYDEADLVHSARTALREGPGDLLGHLVVHLPQDLTRRAAALLSDAAAVAPTTVIAGFTGHAQADAGVRRSLTRLGVTLPDAPPVDGPGGPGGSAVPVPAGFSWPVSPGATRVVTTSDADDEVRAAVRAVVDATRAGTPLERIAILFATDQPYARLVHEHLAAAGIPANGTAPQALAGRALGRTLLDLLALRRHGYRRSDVLNLLTAAPLPPDGRQPRPTAEWERLSREAVVVAGRAHWDIRLERLATELDRRADDAAVLDIPEEAPVDGADVPLLVEPMPDTADAADAASSAGWEQLSLVPPEAAPPLAAEAPAAFDAAEAPEAFDAADAAETPEEPSYARWLRRRAARARELRELVLYLIDEIEAAAAAPAPWRERVRWVRRLARRLLGSDADREAWPAVERKAAERVEAALDRLLALDDVDGATSLDVFQRTLELELDADLGRVGRFGEGVLVAPLSFAVGLDLDLVVVLGMAEGTLPVRVTDDSLLPDRERRVTDGELPLRREQVHRQRRQLHAALAGARSHLLCSPRGDLRASNERMASRWLLEVLQLIEAVGADDATAAGPVEAVVAAPLDDAPALLRSARTIHVPSFAHAVTHLAFPATEQEYRLAAGADWAEGNDPIVAAGRELQAARRSRRFTRFDGNLHEHPVRSPLDDVVSATRLESWAKCPHAYFMRQVLRVEPVDDPADALWISPLDKGSLIHEILERFVLAVLDDPPKPDEPWSAAHHALLREIGSAVCDSYEGRGVVGRHLFWARDRARILMRLDRFLHEDSAYRARTRSRPVAAEMAFGLPGADQEPVDVAIGGGRTLRFRGSADRVDLADDGTLR